jgi:hypothetical protein
MLDGFYGRAISIRLTGCDLTYPPWGSTCPLVVLTNAIPAEGMQTALRGGPVMKVLIDPQA